MEKRSILMAKTKKRNRIHHPVITVIIILLMAGAFVVIAKIFFDQNSLSEPAPEKTKIIQPDPETPQKKEKPTQAEPASVDEDNKKPVQNEGPDPNISEYLTGAITASEVQDQVFILRINIDQYLSTGTCTLTMTKNGRTITKSAEIFASASTSSCQGFDLPVSELSSGLWDINIKLQSGSRTGNISGKANL